MIVDIHTHVWESPEQLGRGAAARLLRSAGQPWERPDASPAAHDAAMEPVQHAFILGVESLQLGASIPMEQVARWTSRRPGKYFGFAGIDPLADGLEQKIQRVTDLGLSGVAINPAAAGFHPAHTQAMRLYEACALRDLPIIVQSVSLLAAEGKLEFAQPYLYDEVAREFPRLKLIIAQAGYPWVEQTIVLIGKHRQVYADLSNVVTRPWQLYNLLLSAHQQGVMEQLLFGSGFPFCTPQKAITTIYSVNTMTQGTMLPSVPREQLRSMVERNVVALLGLAARTGATGATARPAVKPDAGSAAATPSPSPFTATIEAAAAPAAPASPASPTVPAAAAAPTLDATSTDAATVPPDSAPAHEEVALPAASPTPSRNDS